MDSDRLFILYIHGFNSSPASKKAQQFQSYCQQRGDIHIAVPELSYDPEQALNQLQDLIHNADSKVHLIVGSSLGGYYATWLAEKHDCRAALVNPAVSPVKISAKNSWVLRKITIPASNMNSRASMRCSSIPWISILLPGRTTFC